MNKHDLLKLKKHFRNNTNNMTVQEIKKTYFDRLDEARQYAKERITKEYPWVLELRGYINCYFTNTTDIFSEN